MKTPTNLLLLCTMLFSGISAEAQTSASKKILVAYFSHSGNTRAVAEQIRTMTGADLFEIVPATAYSENHQTVVDQAKKEIAAGVRPKLKSAVPNLAQYDVIFVGSPCWWATIAPPVATFLTSYDFSGKTIVPFMTHEGSRMGRTEADIRALCPKATVLSGLPVRGSAASSSKEAVKKWLQELNLTR